MARLNFYAPYTNPVTGDGGSGSRITPSADARRSTSTVFSSLGCANRNQSRVTTLLFGVTGGSGNNQASTYHRAYLRVRVRQASANQYIFSLSDNAGSATDLLRAYLTSNGTLVCTRRNNAGGQTDLATTAVLSLNTWYRIEFKCDITDNTAPTADTMTVELRLNSIQQGVANNVAIGSAASRAATAANWGHVSFVGAPSPDGIEYDLSDLAVDSAEWVGSTRASLVRPTGLGTYDEFTVDANRDWRGMLDTFLATGTVAPSTFASSTADDRVSFTLGTLRSHGITGPLKAVRVCANPIAVGTTPKDFIIRRNGTDTFYSWTPTGGSIQEGYLIDASAWSVDDTIEIGVRNTNGGTMRIANCYLLVDHDTAELPAPDGTIRVLSGTYAGNSTHQTIDLGALDADVADQIPDFIWINPLSGVAPGVIWWSSRLAATLWNNGQSQAEAITPVAGAFHTSGANASWNLTGVSYRWMAFFDANQFISQRGATATNTVDDREVALPDATFIPEMLFCFRDSYSASVINQQFFRGAGYSGDATTSLDQSAAPVADAIQWLSTGRFQLGTLCSSDDHQFAWLTFNTERCSASRLVAHTSYVGDGAVGTRTIPLALTGLTPIFSMVISFGAVASKYVRAGGITRQWTGGTTNASTAITTEGADSITVGTTLNVNSVTYSVLAFAAGTCAETGAIIAGDWDGGGVEDYDMAYKLKPVILSDFRGGRNDTDPPMALPNNQCVEALNVDWKDATLGRKRGGAVAIGITGGTAFNATIATMIRHIPGAAETAAELWGFDSDFTPVKRLTGGTAFADVTMDDAIATNAYAIMGATLNGKLFLAYDSTVDRLHTYDPDLATPRTRRVGFATPAAPTVANTGVGAYAATLRYYRVRWLHLVGTVVERRSEPSTSVSFTPSGAGTAARVTQPAVAGEGETHWEIEASTDNATFYRLSQTVIATTIYDDSAATSTYADNALSDAIGFYARFPSVRYLISDGNRLLGMGAWESAGVDSSGKNARIWFTPVLGSSDRGDDERVPNQTTQKNWIDINEADGGYGTGLGGPINGIPYAFKYRQIWKLRPTGDVAAPYLPRRIRDDVGCIAQKTVALGEDQIGRPALYFLSHRGPYRITIDGNVEYLGRDNEVTWRTMNLAASTVVAHSVYYNELHQWWLWIATGAANTPDVRMILDIQQAFPDQNGQVRGGWAKHDGNGAAATCSCLFSDEIAVNMSQNLVPYIGRASGTAIWRLDTTDLNDAGTGFQAYLKSKPILATEELGRKIGMEEPSILAKTLAGVTITLTTDNGFGIETRTHTATLTASGAETRIFKKFEGGGIGEADIVQIQIGDGAVQEGAWSIDALVIPKTQQEWK